MSHSDIEFIQLQAKNGKVGLITLQRPQALNALTLAMCKAIDDNLVQWEEDDNIKAVVIQGEGERAFCAGGDVRWVYEEGRENPQRALEFFDQEYRMNKRLFHFSKPFIALMHGITMGGGLGVSVHGSHRVGAETLMLAMPETGIGFYPDIGGSYFLPRCPGKFGWHLGLTGDKISANDAFYLGLIDFVIDRSDFAQIIDQLTNLTFEDDAHTQVSQLLKSWQLPMQQSPLIADQAEIDHYYTAKTVEEIVERLQQSSTPRAEQILKMLKEKSPTSLKITLELLHQGAQQDFDTCMDHEFKLTQHFLKHHDFYEGVRAALIDKDRKPLWQPRNLREIDDNLLTQWLG